MAKKSLDPMAARLDASIAEAQAKEADLVAQHQALADQVAAINAQGVQIERDLLTVRGSLAALTVLKGAN